MALDLLDLTGQSGPSLSFRTTHPAICLY